MMDVYIYQADIFCEDCGRAIEDDLDAGGYRPDDRDDESTYDSDEYPKGPFQNAGGEADSLQHCGAHENCLNAIEFNDGSKVGAFLENDLTSDGVAYVCEALREYNGGRGRAFVLDIWAAALGCYCLDDDSRKALEAYRNFRAEEMSKPLFNCYSNSTTVSKGDWESKARKRQDDILHSIFGG